MNGVYDKFYQDMLRICEQTELTRDFDFKKIDSLSRAEVILTTEECFGIALTNDEVLQCQTFGDLEDLIKKKNEP